MERVWIRHAEGRRSPEAGGGRSSPAVVEGPALSPLLTIHEVAAALQISERTIRRMIADRRLPCVRIGRQLRFAPGALSRWLQAREEG